MDVGSVLVAACRCHSSGGYAVLSVNFRYSTGFGKAFHNVPSMR